VCGLASGAEAERPDCLATLEELVSIDTGTGQEPGRAKVQGLPVERLKGLGAEVAVTPASPSAEANVIGTLKGSGEAN